MFGSSAPVRAPLFFSPSMFVHRGRITAKYARIPVLFNLRAIERPLSSISGVSSHPIRGEGAGNKPGPVSADKGRLTANYASFPTTLTDLPLVWRPSTSGVSSHLTRGELNQPGVDLCEACLVTKAINYTHQLYHWIPLPEKDDEVDKIVSEKLSSVLDCV